MAEIKDLRFASILKKWLHELTAEKLLLIASIITFCLTMLSLRERPAQDVPASVGSRKKGVLTERIKNRLGLPEEIQMPKQKISDVVLIEPQTIFMRDDQSNKKEPVSLNLSRNPFFPADFNPQQALAGKKMNDMAIEKEEFLFVGIMNLDDNSASLSVVLKGSKSGQYKILFEGNEMDEIKILSVDGNSARIRNRKGVIQDYTTTPDRYTIK
ncbi:MAG: hypothetical protein HRF42_04050 [Candidatus Brocadia sp.]|jgi:hypothetical protein